jgi:hypothetical protein
MNKWITLSTSMIFYRLTHNNILDERLCGDADLLKRCILFPDAGVTNITDIAATDAHTLATLRYFICTY